jgi:hypothetical protein
MLLPITSKFGKLIASPVPSANQKGVRFKISQGELHAFVGKSIQPGPWIRGLAESFAFFADETSNMENCIVKVSCEHVHAYLVRPLSSWLAILQLAHNRCPSLKKEMAKVLLSGAQVGSCYITVMKDLSKLETPHGTRTGQSKFNAPLDRWQAFRQLVLNLLLPMADWNIVICNVLSYFDEERKSYELALIDFESLVAYGSETAVCDFSASVFWQMLWMAYGWWEVSVKIEAPMFVLNFFNRDADASSLVSIKTQIGAVSIKVLQGDKDTLSDGSVEPEIGSKMFGDILHHLEPLFSGEE